MDELLKVLRDYMYEIQIQAEHVEGTCGEAEYLRGVEFGVYECIKTIESRM